MISIDLTLSPLPASSLFDFWLLIASNLVPKFREGKKSGLSYLL
jgi:hypothetical protein